jgi:hypothetical protein
MMPDPTRYGPHDQYVEVWGCRSESNPEKLYTVARTARDTWSCSCPRWTLNASRPQCKHITHVKNFNARRAFTKIEPPTIPMPEKVKKALSIFSAIEL